MITNNSLNGIILVNKPRGISSNTVVNIVKRAVGADKAGHLGTLDVAGDGLLPVTLGKGTKLFDYYLTKDKVYKTIFKFGQTTDTLDLEGKVTFTDNKITTLEEVKSVIASFIGKMAQMPPAYSAKKIKGQKAYDLARRGEDVVLKPKEIEIYDLQLSEQIKENTFEFLVHCSSGTYIRSLCRDIATKLSTYGVMLSIQRTKCGDFNIEDSFTIEQIKAGDYEIIKLDTLFNYPLLSLSPEQTDRLLNGVWIKTSEKDGLYKACGQSEFLGIIRVINSQIKFELRLI